LLLLQVIGICRSDERGHEAVQQLKEQVPGAKISVKVSNGDSVDKKLCTHFSSLGYGVYS
jgi:hypothetical protein